MEEWYACVFHLALDNLTISPRGACYFTTENNNCPTGSALPASTRNNNIRTWAGQITAAGLPWLYWQVIPNADPHVRCSRRHSFVGLLTCLLFSSARTLRLGS